MHLQNKKNNFKGKKDIFKKYERLIDILKDMESVVLAYSGGVDSTLVLKAIKDSGIRHLAVTASSETISESELKFAKNMAKDLDANLRIIYTEELNNLYFTENPKNRCFYCKDELFSKLTEIANSEGYRFVIDGNNFDDISDWRPGRKAAEKYGVRSPLIEVGLTKAEIRELSKNKGLATWAKPASPCLSSRFPYGVKITREALKKIELSEEFLKQLGFDELRVRYHNDLAKIELTERDINRLLNKTLRNSVVEYLKKLGFKYITIDLEGFRSGRLNEP